MGSGCSTQSTAAVDTHSQRNRQETTSALWEDQVEGASSFLDPSNHAPTPRLLQYLAHGNAADDDSSIEELSAFLSNRHRRRRGSVSDHLHSPTSQLSRSRGGLGQRRLNRRRRHEEDVRFAEVLALQQSLAAMEDFFQSLLSHSHLLLEVMDPAMSEAAGVGGPPPASQTILRSLPRRRWCEVQASKTISASDDDRPNCESCLRCESHHHELQSNEETAELDCTECGVCFEPHQDDDIVTELPCGHVYHLDCVEDWLHRHCTCPSCRYELPTDDIIYERGRKERMKHRSTTTTLLSSQMTTELAGTHAAAVSSSETQVEPDHRMRNVMTESPSSWFIDHLQSRVDEDPPEDYFGRHRRIHEPRSSVPSPALRPMDAEPAIVVDAKEEEANSASSPDFSTSTDPPSSIEGLDGEFVSNEMENEDDGDTTRAERGKMPERNRFPQQDTCVGLCFTDESSLSGKLEDTVSCDITTRSCDMESESELRCSQESFVPNHI